MKKHCLIAAITLIAGLVSCKSGEPQVMARFVPERHDDFIFENNLIAGRLYGRSLEDCGKGEIISPGIDVWVKTPGALVANKRYEDELQNGKSYHINWGNGKDCYKVGKSLGAGASSPIVDGVLCLPATNFRSWEILKESSKEVVFVLKYPEWTIDNGITVSLEKTFTIVPDTYFIKCEDKYEFNGADTLTIAAGVNRHIRQNIMLGEQLSSDRYALWEHASDTSAEPEEGLVGVAVVMPACDRVCLTADQSHAVCCKAIKSGETLTYWFGSCWTEGNIKDFDSWKAETAKIK